MLALEVRESLFEEWMLHLSEQKLEKALEVKKKLDDENIVGLDYATQKTHMLLNARTALLNKDSALGDKYLLRMERYLSNEDSTYDFFYYFLSAISSFIKGKSEQSLYQYKIAGRYLESVSSLSDRAEYHYNIAAVYYEVDKITLSIQHVNQAFDLYNQLSNYKRMADCQCLLGSNHNEIKQHSEAERHYNKALKYGKMIEYPEITKIIHHNLGFFYGEQHKSSEAIKNLELALTMPGKYDNDSLIKTYFLLTRESFRLAQVEEGNSWYEKGIELAKTTTNDEYIYHFRILKTNYDPDYQSYGQLEEEYIDIINYFVDTENWYFVEQYSSILAQYYKDNEEFELACNYYDLAVTAKEKLEFKGALYT